MRRKRASFSTLPLQGCTTVCTSRVLGRQNVSKSEILGCYASAVDTPPGHSVTNILDNLGVVTTLNRGPPTLARHRLRRTNRTTWNLLFGTISRRNIHMDAIWVKGHTKRTSPVNTKHNECDELAGIATDWNSGTPSRFPLYDEDFLIFDQHNDLLECDVKLAALQRGAQVAFDTYNDSPEDSVLATYTQTLSTKP